jgi:hypothetical protein
MRALRPDVSVPAVAVVVLIAAWGSKVSTPVAVVVGALLAGSVLVASTTLKWWLGGWASRWERWSSPWPSP